MLVLVTDDQTVEQMRAMPRVQALLADAGTTFEQAVVNYPLCCPSRATLLTGQFAHNHGVLSNSAPLGGYGRLPKHNSLPLWLQRGGYRTIHLGRTLNLYGWGNPYAIPPGWNEWYTPVGSHAFRYWGYTINENGLLATYGADEDPLGYQTDFLARRGADIISRVAPLPTPFFLLVSFLAPHTGRPSEPGDPTLLGTPAVAPRHRGAFANERLTRHPSFDEADVSDKPVHIRNRTPIPPEYQHAMEAAWKQELESLLAVDEGIALIVEQLAAAGELDNTVVFFTSDHGFFHGEHRIRAGKGLPYDPALRVPLIVRGPGVPAGERRRQLVSNADIAPTILDAAGVEPGRRQDGRSLFPLLADKRLEYGRDILIEGSLQGAVRPTWAGLRTYRYQYVQHENGERELYDLERDPHQLQSLHDDPRYAEVRGILRRRLARLRDCLGEDCYEPPRLRIRVKPGRCAPPRFRAELVGSGVRVTRRVEYYIKRARVGRSRRAPFARRPWRSGVRPKKGFVLRARAHTLDGRVVTVDRELRACPRGRSR